LQEDKVMILEVTLTVLILIDVVVRMYLMKQVIKKINHCFLRTY